jgi:two-component system, NarL family, response regulator LiaR
MDNKQAIRVIIVDDHELLRGGIRFALLSIDDIELVGEANDGEKALSLCVIHQPDVVLMDMRLPGAMDGLATTRAIRTLYPKVKVVALSSFYDRELVAAVLQAGAIGYLVKGVSVKVMADAIRAAHAGRPTLTAEALAALIQTTEPPPPFHHEELSEREQEVLALLAEGLSNAQIAKILVVSVSAVKYHVGNILSKFGATNRTEAVALARKDGLVLKPPRQYK